MLHLPPLRGKWALLAFGTLFSCQGARLFGEPNSFAVSFPKLQRDDSHSSASDTSCVRRVGDDTATPIQTTIPAQPEGSTGGGIAGRDVQP
jgi:hypothetical protein